MASSSPALARADGPEPLPGRCVRWGVLADSWGTDLRQLDAVESAVGERAELFGFYQGWASGEPFDRARADAVTARGALPVLAWEPYDWLRGTEQPEFALARIIRGDHDAYIRSWARDIKRWGKPLMLRFAYEMNGDWMPWSEGVNGNRAGEYVTAWRHVHDIFAAEGAANVSWVWAPNVVYDGGTPLARLYPGDAYVDWIGISGYNWGAGVTAWHSWQGFDEVFGATLRELRALATKPLIITETASAESGGDKAAWIRDLFTSLTRHPDIAAFMWFNYDKETDWRIQSSPLARAAFADGLRGLLPRCDAASGVQRLSTADATTAANLLSRTRFPDPARARHVVVARDDLFADALSGTALTAEGPLLLARGTGLSAATHDELRRVLPRGGRVYLLGGGKALSEAVAAQVQAGGHRPVRLSGADRVETSLAVATEVRRLYGGDRVVVTRSHGRDRDTTAAWADSVAVGGWAARTRTPVLLTPGDRLHPAVSAWLQAHRVTSTYVVGGREAVSDAVERALGARRVAGPTRQETALQIARQLWGVDSWGTRQFTVVNGYRPDGWAFGVAAAGLSADRLAPMVLTGDEPVAEGVRDLVGRCGAFGTSLSVIGSAEVVPSARQQELAGAGC